MKEFKVRDLRKKEQYKIDDEYLNGYARLCGIYATVVYNSLSRHAEFATQQCWPSIKTICEQHNISNKSVIKGIKELEKWGIIKIIKEKDDKTKRQLNNIYILLDKSEWKEKPIRVNDIHTESRVNNREEPSERQEKSRVNDIHCKDNTVIKDNTLEGIATQGVAVNELLGLFEKINPTINYGNITQRKALSDLTEKFGIEKIRSAIEYAVSIYGKQYAPTITTPIQLKNKLSELGAYKLRENKQPLAVKI